MASLGRVSLDNRKFQEIGRSDQRHQLAGWPLCVVVNNSRDGVVTTAYVSLVKSTDLHELFAVQVRDQIAEAIDPSHLSDCRISRELHGRPGNAVQVVADDAQFPRRNALTQPCGDGSEDITTMKCRAYAGAPIPRLVHINQLNQLMAIGQPRQHAVVGSQVDTR